MRDSEVKVWDPLVRIFHWTLVVAFAVVFVTEDDLMGLHVFAGYTIMALLAVRILWGLIGTRHARFSDFVFSPQTILRYLKDVLSFRAKRYLGHNPAGGAMIVIMLVSLILASISGLAAYGAEEHAGPFANFMMDLPRWARKGAEEVHEFFANFSMLLVAVHITGVVLESILHRENLIRAMINGRKRA